MGFFGKRQDDTKKQEKLAKRQEEKERIEKQQEQVREGIKGFFVNATGLRNYDTVPNLTIELEDDKKSLLVKYVPPSMNVKDIRIEEFQIPYNSLCSVKSYTEKEIIEKQRSVLKRAIVGGVLVGGVGAVVGGMSGVGSKKTTNISNYVGVEYICNNEKMLISGEYNIKNAETMIKFISNIHERMPELPPDIKDVHEISNSEDSISKLERLAKLKEQGILTDDEFNIEKKKILGI